jgi:hypothetical protein
MNRLKLIKTEKPLSQAEPVTRGFSASQKIDFQFAEHKLKTKKAPIGPQRAIESFSAR